MGKFHTQNEAYIKKKFIQCCSKKNVKKLVIFFSMQDDPIGNINLAMEIAEKHLDIPKMLDAEGEMKIVFTDLTENLWARYVTATHGDL